ncbi:hypothetical protein Tco_0459821, partial [Tanacetum coccineum]
LCMTRSSTNELFTPNKEPEREFQSSRRHFKTLSLDELRSLDFNLLSDQEYSEAFPMSLTGAASRWLRNEPTGSITTWDGLKTKNLYKYCPPARTAKKMKEINNFQQEPDKKPLASMGAI